MLNLFRAVIIFCSLSIVGIAHADLPLDKIQLPAGFHIQLYAQVPDAREMTLGDNGIVYVGTRKGNVYAVLPNKDLTHAAEVKTIASGLNMPNGVAYRNGDLYIAEVSKITRFDQINQHLDHPQTTVINDQLPTESHHGWRYIGFGPDNWLYLAIGAPCNSCISKDARFATISRIKPDGTNFQIYANGVRNSVGFAWNPQDQKLWFTDNGRDWMGDNLPPDKLNFAPVAGMNFGFPYFYGNNIPDPTFGHLKSAQGMTPPAINLDPHAATLGMKFYTGTMFPPSYRHQIIIAEHGSWNRSKKIGYRLSIVQLKNNKAVSYQPFITGWLQGESNWGRPVDLLVMPDGSLLVSDDYAGVIYRVTYNSKNMQQTV
jgi:glucose/arabinose dehydrogenase